MRFLNRIVSASLIFGVGILSATAADVSDGYVQGPGGYYRKADNSGPYTISPAGVASLIGTIQAGNITTTVGPTISEVTLIDKSTGAVVLRRTIIQPTGAISTVFVDLAGNTINPVLANLVPPGMATSASPVLAALSLSNLNATAGSPYSATISGLTAGSSVSATSSDGTALAVSNGVLSGTFASAGSPTASVTETLSGATGSPKVSNFAVTVSASSAGLTATLADPTFVAAVIH